MQVPSEKHFIHGSIFLLSNRLQTAGDKVTGEITTKQWFLLLVLSAESRKSPTITGIARFMGSSRQNIAKMLRPLEKKGYVMISPHVQDSRSQTAGLTDKGRSELARITAIGEKQLQNLFEGVTPEQIAGTVALFEKLFENLEKLERKGDQYEK